MSFCGFCTGWTRNLGLERRRMLRKFWPSNIAVNVIRAYQKILSPMLPPSCRYWPTCSQYTLQAVQKYGLVRGVLMGAWRILRCNPWSHGGIDPLR